MHSRPGGQIHTAPAVTRPRADRSRSAPGPSSPSAAPNGGRQALAAIQGALGNRDTGRLLSLTAPAGRDTVAPGLIVALQQTIGNAAVQRLLASQLSSPMPVQRKPVKLDGLRYRDDAVEGVHLVQLAEGVEQYRVSGTNLKVWWQADRYVNDDGGHAGTDTITLTAYQSMPRFKQFTEEAKEAIAVEQSGADDATYQNAVSMYILNKFCSNALYTSDELARLAYQSTPLNFQEQGAYVRSEATAFVEALKQSLPLPVGPGLGENVTSVLARNMDFPTVLGQLFRRIPAKAVASDLAPQLSTLVGGIARDLVRSGSLALSKDVHQRALTFVDVSELIKAHSGAIDEKLQSTVVEYREQVVAAIKEQIKPKLIQEFVEKHYPTADGPTKAELRNELNALWDAPATTRTFGANLKAVTTEEQEKKLASEKSVRASKLAEFGVLIGPREPSAKTPSDKELWNSLRGELGAYVTWLRDQPSVTAEEKSLADAGQAHTDREKLMVAAVKSAGSHFSAYLADAGSKNTNRRAVADPKSVFTSLRDLKKRGEDIPSLVLVGGMLQVGTQPVLTMAKGADEVLMRHVDYTLNKGGYIPTPTVAGEQLLKNTGSLQTTLEKIARAQLQLAWSYNTLSEQQQNLKESLESFIAEIAHFNPATYTSRAPAVDQLVKTREAFRQFGERVAEGEDHITVLGKAVVGLVEGVKVLDEGATPPPVLAQFEAALREATASRDDIVKYVRKIQELHELIILQLQAKPRDLPNPNVPEGAQGVHITDYGLKAFAIAYNAAVAQHKDPRAFQIDAYSNIYFELLMKLGVSSKVDTGGTPIKVHTPEGATLRTERPDLVLIDIHPNDASKTAIAMHDVGTVIVEALKPEGTTEERRCTVIVDITLNHLAEPEVAKLKTQVQKYVDNGQLNLVFIQSLAKFAQLGGDKFNGGLIFHYNAPEKWRAFNDEVARSTGEDVVSKTIEDYFKALFAFTETEQVKYLQKIRSNTRYVRDQLASMFKDLGLAKGVVRISENTDEGACYVAFNVREFVATYLPARSPDEDLGATEEAVLKDILYKAIYPMMEKLELPVSIRQSFGFPISNFGDAWTGIRFTIGAETQDLLAQYAQVISYINKRIGDAVSDPLTTDKMTDKAKRETFLKELVTGVESRTRLKEQLDAMVETVKRGVS
jgi:hypothetical protein